MDWKELEEQTIKNRIKAEQKKDNQENNDLNKTMTYCLKKAKEQPNVKSLGYNEYYKIFKKMGIPDRYKTAKLEDFSFDDAKLNKYFELLKKATDFGRGLIICGDYESGKTHFMFAIAKSYMVINSDEYKENSKIPKFVEFADFQDDIRIRDDGKTIGSYISAPLLIIDDFYSNDLENWEKAKLTSIISKRYNNQKPVLITSNLSPLDLKEKCGSRMWQRLEPVNYITEFKFKGCRKRFDNIALEEL